MQWWRSGVLLLAVVVGCSKHEPVPAAGAVPAAPLAARSVRAGLTGEAVRLVKDINLMGASAQPQNLVNVNGTVYFSATDGEHGEELWKSDGTAAGTVLVKDIFPGPGDASPTALTNVGGTLFFIANDGVTGEELWKSDGTAAGTVLVKEIRPGYTAANLADLTKVGGTLFFTANDGVNGQELWKSDGTAAGTVLVKDITPNYDGTAPAHLTNLNGTLFFTANAALTGQELWKSDGTAAGTVLVKDISPGTSGSYPDTLRNVDGTLFFSVNDGVNGQELWKSDGTAAGTVLVKDLFPGTRSATPYFLTNVNGTLFFAANDGVNGQELWKSDGTAAGTVLVKDLFPGAQGGTPEGLKNINGTLYFTARTSAAWGLWKSDGTAAGTVLLRTLRPFEAGRSIALTDVDGTPYFGADDGVNGMQLWKSDGTAEGTVMLRDLHPGTSSSTPQFLANVNGTLYFGATDGVTGRELWKSDGTAAGTVLVKDIFPGEGDAAPEFLTNVNGTLYFAATDSVTGRELWKSDGTAAGTVLVKNIASSWVSSDPQRLTNVNGTLYFSIAAGINSRQLWKSDGTEEGTLPVRDSASKPIIDPGEMLNVNGMLFFSSPLDFGWGLWKSDGTAAPPVLLKTFSRDGPLGPSSMTNANGMLFFAASDGVKGQELWKSDGTAAGTVLVKDILQGSRGSKPSYLMNVNGTVYFQADDEQHGRELWSSNGTDVSTVLVKDIAPGVDSASPEPRTSFNGTLYFTASTRETGNELWKSDGTPVGTVLVKDILPGGQGAYPSLLANMNGTLYLRARDGVNGWELWRSDGTEAGTLLLQDVFPGPGDGSPSAMIQVGQDMFFTATTRLHGHELWMLGDDTSPPTLTCPANQRTLTTSVSGARVTYPPATARDDRTAVPALTYSMESGSLFALGSTSVTVTATDDAGNTARCAFTVDVLPPEPTLSAPVSGASSPSPVAVAGTALEGATVSAWEGSTVLGTVTADASGAFSGSLALEPRVYSLRFTQTLGGATSAATAARTVSVRPPPPGISAPSHGLSTTEPVVSVSGSGVPGATVIAWENSTSLKSFTVTGAGTFAGTVTLGYGVHGLYFTQHTAGGRSAEVERTVTVQPPAPVLTRPTQGASLVGATVRVEGLGLAGATVRLLDGTSTVSTFFAERDGTFAQSVTLAYGTRRLTAVQTTAGQQSPASEPVSFEVRPPVANVGPPVNGAFLDGPTVTVVAWVVVGAQLEVREGGTVLATLTERYSGYIESEVALAPGAHSLTFVQKAGGARSDAVGPRNVSVRPPVPVLTAPATQARVPGPEVLLEGTALAGARVSAEASGAPLGNTLADASGAFRLRVTLPYGPRTVSVRQAVDSISGPARLVDFTVIPAPPVLSQPLDGATVGREVDVRGGGVPGARVTLREGTSELALADVDANGAFVMNVSLTHGPHTLSAVQRFQGQDSQSSAPVHLQAVFNRAPIADARELSVAEDGRLALTLTAQDPDGDALVFTVRTPPAHGALEGTPPALTYVPGPDFHGADRFTFAVSDGQAEATATVRLTVTPVNDAPVATALTATTGEGQPVSLTLSGTDVDGDRLSYEVVTGPAHGRLQGTPPEVAYVPVAGFAGADGFSFRVSDGQRQSPPATVSLRVVASTLTVSVSDLQPLEGSAVSFSAALADASATPVFAWDFGDGTRSSEPTPRHVFADDGVYTVGVSATDADGTRQASVLVTVRNAPPVVTSLSLPEGVLEAQEVELSATAVDPAGGTDTLEYSWNFGDGSPEARGARVRHAFRDDGAFSVVLTVRDEDGGETRAQALLAVANVPPQALPPGRQTLQVGKSLSLVLSASDVAGAEDPLTWKKLGGPGAVTPEGLFTWAPTMADVGEASVRLEVSDDEGGRAEVTLVVEVLPPDPTPPTPDTTPPTPDPTASTGYGCGTSGGASGLFALLSGLLVASRRRERFP